MGEARFTPGPWGAEKGLVGAFIEGRREWTRVASAGGQTEFMPPGEAEANARLIAAAPSLYAALDAIVNGSGGKKAYADARAALRLARGEEDV